MDSKYTYEDENELYDFLEKIGEGAFSIVHKALFKPTGEIMAVKILKQERCTPKVIESVKTEANILNKLDHPNVIKVKHLIQLNNMFYMGMQYLPGDSLHTYLDSRFKNDQKLSDLEASQLIKGIISGMVYLHSQGIIHRDLKP